MTLPVAERISVALRAGRPREAAEVLDTERPALDRALVPLAAEALAASGRERRATALLVLAARRFPDDRAVALEAGRALLRRGMRRRAIRAIATHNAPVLVAVATRQALPSASAAEDREDEIDRALAASSTTVDLQSLLERATSSVRLRIAVAARALDENRAADARAILRAGLQGREDARLELALASVAMVAGTWDEAAIVVARTRARFPRLARDPAVTALHGFITAAAGRRDETISLLQSAGAGPVAGAILSVLALPTRPSPMATAAPGGTATPSSTPTGMARSATVSKMAAGSPAPMAPAAAMLPITTSGPRPMSALMQATLARAAQGSGKSAGGAASGAVSSSGDAAAAAAAPLSEHHGELGERRPTPSAPSTAAPGRRGGALGSKRPTPSTPTKRPATAQPTAADPQGERSAATFRRLDATPEDSTSKARPVGFVVAVLCVGVAAFGALRPSPRAAVAEPPPPRSTFAASLERCGFHVAPWIDVNVAPTSLAADAQQQGWLDHAASVTAEPTALDAMLQPQAKLISLRTGARIEPALVVSSNNDRVLGVGWFAATQQRPPVTNLVGALKFQRISQWACPQAGPGASCVVGTTRCHDLMIRVQAICAGPTTASLMPRCALDAAVVGPHALLGPSPTAPPPR
jgi:hypothetical protein